MRRADPCLPQNELTSKMEQKVTLVRDGKAQHMLTRLLVPGDVILLTGGDMVPADVDWLEGDCLAIDTAALTGESMPRKYPSENHGNRILGGCTVVSGEAYAIVRKTGSHTEIGQTQEAVMQDKAQKKVSLFESRILLVVKIIITVSLLDVLVIFIVRGVKDNQFTPAGIRPLLLTVLSIMVASVPVALPLVLQVTMALGASLMATKYDAVVTSLPALQDISSMTILCSDKTGTLTTARISILRDSIITFGFSFEDLLLYTRLASNADKEDDPIDRACLTFFESRASPTVKVHLLDHQMIRSVGFTSTYKRTVWVYRHPQLGAVTVAKGLPNKVIDTEDGGADDAADQWKVEGHEALLGQVERITQSFSERGYKSLGVAVRLGEQPWRFVGLLPMLDPPRHDTARTIERLHAAGVGVKMITGDQLNIARETARLIGMRDEHFLRGQEIRQNNQRDQKIFQADGFAEVLPQDKRQIVNSLKDRQEVVGMTGDGVNDVSALSTAQCGIAVDGATDAAKNAASILLTAPGLSAVYSALVESRRIFRKLRAYVVYRLAATIQIVVALTLFIFVAGCAVRPLFVVMLALFNDLTMMPIAYDTQKAGAAPDNPSVSKIFLLSLGLGIVQATFTVLFGFFAERTGIFEGDLDIFNCSAQAQSAVWLQLVLSTELLIFSTRAPKLIWASVPPHYLLITAVFLGCMILSVFALAVPTFGGLFIGDILLIWVYGLLVVNAVDIAKMGGLALLGEADFQELQDTGEAEAAEEEEAKEEDVEAAGRSRAATAETMEDQMTKYIRLSSRLRGFNRWLQKEKSSYEENVLHIVEQNRRALSDTLEMTTELKDQERDQLGARRTISAPGSLRRAHAPPHGLQQRYEASRIFDTLYAPPQQQEHNWLDLSRTLSGVNIRPHTPAHLASLLTDKHRAQLRAQMDK